MLNKKNIFIIIFSIVIIAAIIGAIFSGLLNKNEKIKLKIAATTKATPMQLKIVEQLENKGFQVDLETPDFNKVLEMVKQNKSEYDLIFLGEHFEMPYAHKALEDYFLTNSNSFNICGIDKDDQPHIEDKITLAKKQTNENTYKQKIFEIEKYIKNNYYVLPLTESKSNILADKNIDKEFMKKDLFGNLIKLNEIKPYNNKNKITLVMKVDIKGFDPTDKNHAQSSYTEKYLNLVHANLLTSDENNKLKPFLLKTIPQLKDDNTLECELNTDIFFHNNEKITTDDVIFSIERGKKNDYDLYKQIDHIKKIDDKRFTITLDKDIHKLSWHFPFTRAIRIINKKAVEENESEGIKIGAGPFKLKTYNPNDKIELESFNNNEIIKTIILKISKDDNTNLQNLENGNIEVILDYPAEQIQILKQKIKDNEIKNIQIIESAQASSSYIYFNKTKTEKKIRKKISESINVQQIIKDLNLSSELQIAKTFINSNIIGHDPNLDYHKHE